MNHDAYTQTRQFNPGGVPMHMDTLHIDVLYRIAMAAPEGAVISEIGSFKGASTSAWLEAMKVREDLTLHVIDINLEDELLNTIALSGVDKRVVVHTYPSDQSLLPSDIVLIDGDHGMQAYADLAKALLVGCDIIIMHDSQTAVKTTIPGCEGSHGASRLLRDCPQRGVWEDSELRNGMHTERGLLVSWPHDRAWVRPETFLPGVMTESEAFMAELKARIARGDKDVMALVKPFEMP